MDLKGSSFESMSAVLKKIGELINPFGRNVTTHAIILSAKQRFNTVLVQFWYVQMTFLVYTCVFIQIFFPSFSV